MELFAPGDDNKMQYDDIVMHWVLYPFNDDIISIIYFVDVVIA